MYVKRLRVYDETKEFCDKQVIGVFDESRLFQRAIDALFLTNVVSRDGTFLSPAPIECEAEAYGYTIRRTIRATAKHTRRAGVFKDELTFVGETFVPQKIDLPRAVKRFAQQDFSSFFDDPFTQRMVFLGLYEPSEYIAQAESFWENACEEKAFGLCKRDLKKIRVAIDRFKRDLPTKKPLDVPDELYDFFMGNALHKVVFDALGKESLPLFLTDSLKDLSDEELQNVVSLARRSGRQVFVWEGTPRANADGAFDVTITL